MNNIQKLFVKNVLVMPKMVILQVNNIVHRYVVDLVLHPHGIAPIFLKM